MNIIRLRISSNSMTFRRQRSRGFTLIELMVVIAIIGVLVALLLPAVQQTRESARRAQCQSQLKQFALALHNYHEQHNVLPPGSMSTGPFYKPYSGWGWCALTLPHLDQSPLYNRIDFDYHNLIGKNASVVQNVVPFMFCPSDSSPTTIQAKPTAGGTPHRIAAGNYLGVESMLRELSHIQFSEVTDGLSNTLMLGEHRYEVDPIYGDESTSSWIGWATFANEFVTDSIPHFGANSTAPINDSVFSSRHPGGSQFALGDGQVRFLSENIDSSVYSALGTRNGQEVVSF